MPKSFYLLVIKEYHITAFVRSNCSNRGNLQRKELTSYSAKNHQEKRRVFVRELEEGSESNQIKHRGRPDVSSLCSIASAMGLSLNLSTFGRVEASTAADV